MTIYFQAIAAAIVAAFLFGGGWTVKGWKTDSALQKKDAQIAAIHQQYDNERLKATEKANQNTQKQVNEYVDLQSKTVQIEESKNEQITTLSARASVLAGRVRSAEASAATARVVSKTLATAANEQADPVSDGPLVLGSLGVEDVEEAERADKLRVGLLACYAQYDAAGAKAQE